MNMVKGLTLPKQEETESEFTLQSGVNDFHAIAYEAPLLICVIDTENNCIWCNKRWLDYTGRTMIEIATEGWIRDVHPDELDDFLRDAGSAIAEHQSFEFEYRLKQADGSYGYIELSGCPRFLADGELKAYTLYGREVSQHKQMEAALITREQEFRSLTENSPDVIIRYDRDCRRIYANTAAGRMGGKPVETLINAAPTDGQLLVPNQAEKLIQGIRGVFECGETRQIEIYTEKNNKRYDHNLLLVPEVGREGDVATVLAIGRDVTATRVAEQRLTQFVANFPGFAYSFHQSPEGHSSFPFASPGIEKLYGLKPEDVKADMAPLYNLMHPEDRPHIEAAIAESAQSMKPLQAEFRICRPDMPERWIETRSIPLLESDGSIIWHGLMIDVTERKQTEAELSLLTYAMNQVQEAAYLSKDSGRFLYVNVAASNDLGYTRDELLCMSVSDVLEEFSVEGWQAHNEELIQKGSLALEERHKRKDGTIFPVHVNVTHFEHNDAYYSLALVHDITEYKRIETELRSQSDFQQTLLQALCDVGMQLMMIENGKIIHIGNRELAHQFGYTDVEIDAQPALADIIHPDDKDWVLDHYHRRLAGETVPVSYELGLVTLDGERREYETAISIVPGTNPVRMITVGQDISDRKHMERIIEESRNFLNNIVNSIPDPVFVKDRQHRWILLNEAFCQFIGYPQDELLGKSDYDFFSEQEARVFWEKDEIVFISGEENVNEEEFTDSDGVSHTIVTKKSLYTDDAGQSFIVGIIMDITDRKALETARENALKEAIRLAQMRSIFLSQMSHELRTPLNGILGSTQILQLDDEINKEQKSFIKIIEQSGNHLLSLVNDILDHAKLEEGKQKLNMGDIQMDTFLTAVAGIIRVKSDQKQLDFLCEVATDLPSMIRGDELRLRQVILNLLANAVKFTDHGQVSLRVNSPAQGRMRFEVQDSGIGISEEHLESIFLPFEQVGDPDRFASGTGLGLAISRMLVRLMGSDIKIKSRKGEGSLFSFELNVDVVDSEPVEFNALTKRVAQPLRGVIAPLSVPPANELEALYKLARRGNMRSIIKHATSLIEFNEEYLHFSEQLKRMAEGYQSKSIVTFLEQYLENKPGSKEV